MSAPAVVRLLTRVLSRTQSTDDYRSLACPVRTAKAASQQLPLRLHPAMPPKVAPIELMSECAPRTAGAPTGSGSRSESVSQSLPMAHGGVVWVQLVGAGI